MESPVPEAQRLEQLWGGQFGDEYVERNADAYASREQFWSQLLPPLNARSALEVGCNVGGNLRWLARCIDPAAVFGIDVNRKALALLRAQQPEVNAVWSVARELPFRDRWFDLVLSFGVLIHQPEITLPLVMAEMVRCSNHWILCGEYFDEETREVPYRGQEGALFRRDYGRIFAESFPDLELADTGFLGRDDGWDDITWWLFEKKTR